MTVSGVGPKSKIGVFDSIVSRKGILGKTARIAGFAGSMLTAGAPLVNSLGCGSPTENVKCTRSINLIDEATARRFDKQASVYLSGGKIVYTVDLPIPADGAMGRLDELKLGGNIYVKVFSDNTSINEAYKDYHGLVVKGMFLKITVPSPLPAGDKAEDYAVGGKMLKGVGDKGKDSEKRTISATWSRMMVYVTDKDGSGKEIKTLKPVSRYGSDLVVAVKCASEDLDLCPNPVTYFKVNADGAVTTEPVKVDDTAKLTEAFSFYRIFPEGKYWDKNADGSPKADSSLEAKDYEILLDEKITISDLLNGNPAKGIGKLDPKSNNLPLNVTVTAVDGRSPSQGSAPLTVDSSGNVIAVELKGSDGMKDLLVPQSHYSNGDIKETISLKMVGDSKFIINQDFAYGFVATATATVRDVPTDKCQ